MCSFRAPDSRTESSSLCSPCYFFFQAEDGIRDYKVTGVQTCALPISDDGHRIVVHEDLLADDRTVAGEAADPVGVAQDDDGMSLVDLIVLLRVEHTPDRKSVV